MLMSKEKKDRGRPPTKYDEKELWAIIAHYRENMKPQGDIKYLQLYKYHLDLHKKQPDIFSRIYSEDFWRKKGQPGREIIDTANQVRTVNLLDSNNNKKDIPNVVDIVHKYSKDSVRLMNHLMPLENEVRRSLEREEELKQKNELLHEQINQEKRSKKELRDQVSLLQECILKLFHYSPPDGTPIENLLNINNKNKRIKRALDEAWSQPQEFYTDLDKFQQKIIYETTQTDNIVSLENAKKKRTLADDFDGRF